MKLCSSLFAVAASLAAAAEAAPAGESVVQLSPFEVQSGKDIGYQTASTTSGTLTGELLRNLPLSVSVLNQEFLKDIAITDAMEALSLYGIGSEPASIPGIGLPGVGGGGNLLVFRGINSSWQGRDGFVWYGISDNYSVETLEITRGPTGNVFGDARAGGLPNILSKRAKLRNFGELNLRWDSESSKRATFDYNRKLNNKLALRLNLMKSDARDWRDTAFDRRTGVQLGLQYEPTPNTRLSLVAQSDTADRIAPDTLRIDNFREYVPGTGTNAPGTIAGTRVMQGAGSTQRWTHIGGKRYNLISSATQVFRDTTVSSANSFPVDAGSNPAHMQWNGSSDRWDHDSESLLAVLEHRFGANTVVQAAFNYIYSDRFDFFANYDGIRRDVNPNLPGPNGTLVPNPNYEQLYVEHRYTQNEYFNHTRSYRLSGVHDVDLRFTQQRIVLNLSRRDDPFELQNRGELLTPAAIAAAGLTGAAALPTNNAVRRRFYLKDGNGGIGHTTSSDYTFYNISGTQQNRMWLYSGSALFLGRYWKDRILSTAGIRRDNLEIRRVNAVVDPATGFASWETGAAGEQIWREQLGIYNTSINYGLVFAPQPYWRVFANYGENFQQQGAEPYFNGDARKPRIGDGVDYGASLYFGDKVSATVTWFDNKSNYENVTAIDNQNTVDEINRLLGTSYSMAFRRDTQARQAKGTEVEITTNPIRNWTLSFKYSIRRNVNTDFVPRFAEVLAAMKAATTDATKYTLTQNRMNQLIAESAASRMSWNFSTRYTFTSGLLKGARVGAYGYYLPGRWTVPGNRPPLEFKSYVMVNAFAGYSWRIKDRYRYDLQLNVENLRDLRTQIGSTYTSSTYLGPRKFILQNTLHF